MSTYHVAFQATIPDRILDSTKAESELRARSWLLSQSWYERRQIAWRPTITPISGRSQSPIRHDAQLDLDCPRTAQPRTGSLTLSIKVAVINGEDPLAKAQRVLDLPGCGPALTRAVKPDDPLERGSFSSLRSNSVIGPVPPEWPIDRMLTAYSSHLGSYGQGGVGLSGWQCNGGSWIVLPLKYSDGWIWLTREQIAPASDYWTLGIDIDQRILGVHPKDLAAFPPWEHCYAGHDQVLDLPDFAREKATISRFEADDGGFVLEAVNGLTRWRFAMSDDLPRPVWAGSREPRQLYQGESVARAIVLTHDCYLDV